MIVKQIIDKHGGNMGKTIEILMEMAEEKRLCTKKDIKEEEVTQALNEKRCVLVRYRVTKM